MGLTRVHRIAARPIDKEVLRQEVQAATPAVIHYLPRGRAFARERDAYDCEYNTRGVLAHLTAGPPVTSCTCHYA